jgi:hypothetical protein
MHRNGKGGICFDQLPGIIYRISADGSGMRDLTNTDVEVRFVRDEIQCSEYELPQSD